MDNIKHIIREEIESLLSEGRYDFSMCNRYINDMSFRYKINYYLSNNGYLFHGSDKQFKQFDPSKIKGGCRGPFGYGAYFTDEAYKVDEYSLYGNYYFLYSKDFNILDCDMNATDFHDLDNILEEYNNLSIKLSQYNDLLDNCRNNREYDVYNDKIEDIKYKINTFSSSLLDLAKYYQKYNDKSLIDCFKRIWGNTYIREEYMSKLFLKLGYDGFKVDNQYIIFNFDKLNKNLVSDNELLITDAYEHLNNK